MVELTELVEVPCSSVEKCVVGLLKCGCCKMMGVVVKKIVVKKSLMVLVIKKMVVVKKMVVKKIMVRKIVVKKIVEQSCAVVVVTVVRLCCTLLLCISRVRGQTRSDRLPSLKVPMVQGRLCRLSVRAIIRRS